MPPISLDIKLCKKQMLSYVTTPEGLGDRVYIFNIISEICKNILITQDFYKTKATKFNKTTESQQNFPSKC